MIYLEPLRGLQSTIIKFINTRLFILSSELIQNVERETTLINGYYCDLKIYCVLFDYCLFSLPAFGVFMKLFCDYFACDAFSGVLCDYFGIILPATLFLVYLYDSCWFTLPVTLPLMY